MHAKEMISDVMPALKTSDTGNKAISWMEFFKVSHLPIVNQTEFLGLISESDVYDVNCGSEPIGNHKLSLMRPYVFEEQHVYEVIDLASRLRLSVVPVLNKNKEYLGVISQQDIIKQFTKISALGEAGSIIKLEMAVHDYLLSEIAQIVEGNNAKILSLYVAADEGSSRLKITLKLNVTDITSIIQTFNRYDYVIKASYKNEDELQNLYRDRFDSFLNYLNV